MIGLTRPPPHPDRCACKHCDRHARRLAAFVAMTPPAPQEEVAQLLFYRDLLRKREICILRHDPGGFRAAVRAYEEKLDVCRQALAAGLPDPETIPWPERKIVRRLQALREEAARTGDRRILQELRAQAVVFSAAHTLDLLCF